ncbi:CHRD domain-containing protein [Fibrella forsythiae]|uniref:CHRD domain-containing protein n=1 Tax=Fibrella forsythiae TaxID=2817061 RepID=A0ABS3JC54_9BACT|nr:CHRD domain-containing protein [Fibrella forsythiae]MBO0947588.1 CHRD domain-containing protein [Fibrella forsythiae]
MKNKTALLSMSALLALGLTFTSCKKDDPVVTTPTTTRFTATLNGINEKPTSTTSPATGTFVGNLDEASRVLSYTVTYSGFPTSSTVTMGHLHRVATGDAAGVNGVGSPEIFFPSLTSPIIGTSSTLTQAKVDSMKNGFYYANIHTNNYPNGAIRGNVTRQ